MGRIWMLGDNVNTDVIIPGRYNVTTDRAQLARYCLCEVLPEFAQQVQAGDVVMAGHNFGCGSSREHAPAALQACGVQVVIARSFARIFYRNAINIGFPIFESQEAYQQIEEGDEVEIDPGTGVVRDVTRDIEFRAAPFPEFLQAIMNMGGLRGYAEERLRQRSAAKA